MSRAIIIEVRIWTGRIVVSWNTILQYKINTVQLPFTQWLYRAQLSMQLEFKFDVNCTDYYTSTSSMRLERDIQVIHTQKKKKNSRTPSLEL